MEISATELPDILFSRVIVQISLSVLLVLVDITQVYISLTVGYFHLTHHPAIDPLAFVLLAPRQHQNTTTRELADLDVFDLFEYGSPAVGSLEYLENLDTI